MTLIITEPARLIYQVNSDNEYKKEGITVHLVILCYFWKHTQTYKKRTKINFIRLNAQPCLCLWNQVYQQVAFILTIAVSNVNPNDGAQ